MSTKINGFKITRDEFIKLAALKDWCYDIETFQNYYLAMYKFEDTVVYFDSRGFFEWAKYKFWHESITAYGFNNNYFDNPISCAYGRFQYEPSDAYNFAQEIINSQDYNIPLYKILKSRGLNYGWTNNTAKHYDIKDVAFGNASLKFYGAVIDAPKLQDLPYPHDAVLTESQMQDVFEYCENDIDTTMLLRSKLDDAFLIREDLGLRYGLNLKSKKDAQVAEGVLLRSREIETGQAVPKPNYPEDFRFNYDVPSYIKFSTPPLQKLLDEIRGMEFSLWCGKVVLGAMAKRVVSVAGYSYRMGIGGLHSMESRITHKADANTLLVDTDVTSYYPNIIIRNKYCPQTYGDTFTDVYNGILVKRQEAKKAKNSLLADGLKIPLNASFGKFGEQYSPLYSPQMMLGVTLTGQLGLLMLIERLTQYGFECVSANTDGVVSKIPKSREDEFMAHIEWWERETGFNMERTDYQVLYSRDVNNYIAIKTNGEAKAKGEYSSYGISPLQAKAPRAQIVKDAIIAKLSKDISVRETVTSCRDIRKFLIATNVKGGAYYRGNKLGRVVRFYYANSCPYGITNASGGAVPEAHNVKPMMNLIETLPEDLAIEAYIRSAEKMLAADFNGPAFVGDLFGDIRFD